MTYSRQIFARNLRILIGDRSVSHIAREIGINRTQFNRYLTGETSPQVDVLLRICRHFGTDANILLHPVDAATDPPERSLLRRVLSECTVTFNPDTKLRTAAELIAALAAAFPNEDLAILPPSHPTPAASSQPNGDLS